MLFSLALRRKKRDKIDVATLIVTGFSLQVTLARYKIDFVYWIVKILVKNNNYLEFAMKLKNAIGLLFLGLLAQILVSCDPWVAVHVARGTALTTIKPLDGAYDESPYSSRTIGIIDSVQMERVAILDFYTIRIFSGDSWYYYALKLKIKNISMDTLSFDYVLRDIHTDTINAPPRRKDYLNSVTRLAPNTLIEHRMDSIYGYQAFDSVSFSLKNLTRKK